MSPKLTKYHGIKIDESLCLLPLSSFLVYIKTLPETEKAVIGHIIPYPSKMKDITEIVTSGNHSLGSA